jgi:hypothetical protein
MHLEFNNYPVKKRIQLLIIYRDPISITRPFDDLEINQHNATQRYPIQVNTWRWQPDRSLNLHTLHIKSVHFRSREKKRYIH